MTERLIAVNSMRENKKSLTFKIDRDLKRAPYKFSVDRKAVSAILEDLGIPSNLQGRYRVNLGTIHEEPFKHLMGSYHQLKNEIGVYLGEHWNEFEGYLEIAKAIADGKTRPKPNTFVDFIRTKKLPSYLANAPKDRALSFSKKLFEQGLNRRLKYTLAHEIGHLVDRHFSSTGKKVLDFSPAAFLASGVGAMIFSNGEPRTFLIGLGSSAYALISAGFRNRRAESVANKFAEKILVNQNYKNFISIRPKES